MQQIYLGRFLPKKASLKMPKANKYTQQIYRPTKQKIQYRVHSLATTRNSEIVIWSLPYLSHKVFRRACFSVAFLLLVIPTALLLTYFAVNLTRRACFSVFFFLLLVIPTTLLLTNFVVNSTRRASL